MPKQNDESGSLGDFAVDFDSPLSEDVILRRKSESGEEVAVSALLGPDRFEENSKYPREVRMKVCIRKPSMSSIMQFDCGAFSMGVNKSSFNIYSAHYIPSLSCLDSSVYRGPSFR
ncbi:hypothetical protein Leryth_012227 [Lithospermum erythrorhizon]|nr:hypothetical protein Leryth_012227 [Lithospermum erythrorhizon]